MQSKKRPGMCLTLYASNIVIWQMQLLKDKKRSTCMLWKLHMGNHKVYSCHCTDSGLSPDGCATKVKYDPSPWHLPTMRSVASQRNKGRSHVLHANDLNSQVSDALGLVFNGGGKSINLPSLGLDQLVRPSFCFKVAVISLLRTSFGGGLQECTSCILSNAATALPMAATLVLRSPDSAAKAAASFSFLDIAQVFLHANDLNSQVSDALGLVFNGGGKSINLLSLGLDQLVKRCQGCLFCGCDLGQSCRHGASDLSALKKRTGWWTRLRRKRSNPPAQHPGVLTVVDKFLEKEHQSPQSWP